MNFRVALKTTPANLLDVMTGAAWKREMGKQLEDAGNKAVQWARVTYRRGASATSTAVRSGRLLRSYSHEVRDLGRRGFELDYGPIRAASGEVVKHARIHEGYDAAGNRVSQFVIRPRNKKALRFPIYKAGRAGKGVKGGMAKKNIEKWVFATKVVLKPRPTFEGVTERLNKELPQRGRVAFAKVFGDA